MPRPKTIPRHEGKILLHNEQTLEKLRIPSGCRTEDLAAVMLVLTRHIESAASYFEIQTGRELFVVSDGKAGFTWCIEDTTLNSSQYTWLKSKCIKMEKEVVTRMNQHGIKNALSNQNHY